MGGSFFRTVLGWLAALFCLGLVLPLLIAALPLLVVSLLTRALSRLLEPDYLTHDQLIEYDATFGWRPRSNLNTYHLNVDLFQITTDAQGWRGRATLKDSEVIVIGDSFAAGYGVSDEHFYANLTSSPQIKPIGTGGYSLVQELLWMRHLGQALEGKLIVWFIYLANDIHENLCPDLHGYRRPFLRQSKRTAEWQFVTAHISPQPWTMDARGRLGGSFDLVRLAELSSDSFLSRRCYSACEFLIGQGRDLCNKVRANLVVMTIPDAHQLAPEGRRLLLSLGGDVAGFDPDYPDKQIEGICRKLGVGFLAGKSFLDPSYYKSNDCHWNEKGHRKVAQAVAELWAARRTANAKHPATADMGAG